MAWVKFTADIDWSPRYGVTIAYKAGMTQNVPSAAATLVIAAGKAVRMKKVSKDSEPTYAHIDTKETVVDGRLHTERIGSPVYLKSQEVSDG